MTTRVMVVTNLPANYECHIHRERRDEGGRFVRDDASTVIKGPASSVFTELYLPDDGQIVVTEHHVVGAPPA